MVCALCSALLPRPLSTVWRKRRVQICKIRSFVPSCSGMLRACVDICVKRKSRIYRTSVRPRLYGKPASRLSHRLNGVPSSTSFDSDDCVGATVACVCTCATNCLECCVSARAHVFFGLIPSCNHNNVATFDGINKRCHGRRSRPRTVSIKRFRCFDCKRGWVENYDVKPTSTWHVEHCVIYVESSVIAVRPSRGSNFKHHVTKK